MAKDFTCEHDVPRELFLGSEPTCTRWISPNTHPKLSDSFVRRNVRALELPVSVRVRPLGNLGGLSCPRPGPPYVGLTSLVLQLDISPICLIITESKGLYVYVV